MDVILILLQRVNVLIPSYTIHFSRSGRHRPLGIAYAEFKTPEQIESVIKEFDGHVLKNRKIAVKKHMAYDPNNRRFSFKRKSSIKNGKRNQTGSLSSEMPVLVAKESLLHDDETVSIKQPKKTHSGKKELSMDTIMIQRVYGKVTDESLRDFFKEYNPSQIYIFKSRKPKLNPMNFTGSHVSVLAKLDASKIKLEDIIFNLKSRKLNGKHINMKPAYKSKVLEVEKAIAQLKSLENTEGGGDTNCNDSVVVNEKTSIANKDGKNNDGENLAISLIGTVSNC